MYDVDVEEIPDLQDIETNLNNANKKKSLEEELGISPVR
jgi:hypothetical protein